MFGGVNGFLAGTYGVDKILSDDPVSRRRIDNAFSQLLEEKFRREGEGDGVWDRDNGVEDQ